MLAGQTPPLGRRSVDLLEQLDLGGWLEAGDAAEVGRRASLGEAEGIGPQVLVAKEALDALPSRVEDRRGGVQDAPLAVSAVSGFVPELAADSAEVAHAGPMPSSLRKLGPLWSSCPPSSAYQGQVCSAVENLGGPKMEEATKRGCQVAFRKQGRVMIMPACGEDSRQIGAQA